MKKVGKKHNTRYVARTSISPELAEKVEEDITAKQSNESAVIREILVSHYFPDQPKVAVKKSAKKKAS